MTVYKTVKKNGWRFLKFSKTYLIDTEFDLKTLKILLWYSFKYLWTKFFFRAGEEFGTNLSWLIISSVCCLFVVLFIFSFCASTGLLLDLRFKLSPFGLFLSFTSIWSNWELERDAKCSGERNCYFVFNYSRPIHVLWSLF